MSRLSTRIGKLEMELSPPKTLKDLTDDELDELIRETEQEILQEMDRLPPEERKKAELEFAQMKERA